MAKRTPSYRACVLVCPMTQTAFAHTAHGGRRENPNPYTDWGWVGSDGVIHRGFTRLEEAKVDVERVYGPTDFDSDGRSGFWGHYGPSYGPDEWLALSQPKELP